MLRKMNRFLIVILLGFAVYLCAGIALVAARWRSLSANPSGLLDALATGFLTDTTFFLLVGIAGVLAQFYGQKGDVLAQRIQRVFANDEVSIPVVDFFEEVAKANSVYARAAEHLITVLEYRADICAYRAEFYNRYVLRNAFGDIPYQSDIQVEVARDFARDGVDPKSIVTSIVLTQGREGEEFVPEKIRVPAEGVKQIVPVSLGPSSEAVLEMRWWSWIDAKGDWDSGFSVKRFSERFTVVIANKVHRPIRIARTKDSEDLIIEDGMRFTFADEAHLPPKTRIEFFWRPPDGEEVPADLATTGSNSTLLDFENRLGETKINEL